jgi:hypothetical protein
MNAKDRVLTSVKVDKEIFEEYKVACVKYKFNFQKLADRAMHLYLIDEDFRRKLNSHKL